jgi:hypothetical protein
MTAKKVQFWQLFAQKTEEKRVLGCYKKKIPVNIKRAKKIIWTVIVKKKLIWTVTSPTRFKPSV